MTPNDGILVLIGELRVQLAERDAQIEAMTEHIAALTAHHEEAATPKGEPPSVA